MTSIVELRGLSTEELEDKLEDAREELFNLRFQRASAQLENYTRIKTVRREMARLQEAMHKRQLAEDAAVAHPAIASALADKTWDVSANFVYEDSAWQVDFTDEGGKSIASAQVDLNRKRVRGRKARFTSHPSDLVKSYEVGG